MPLGWKECDRLTIRFSGPDTPIIGALLSHSAQYLAVGYNKQVDLWDLRKTISSAPHSIYGSKTLRPTTFDWSPNTPRLIVGYDLGVVDVISLNEKSAAIEGFTLRSPGRVLSTKFLNRDLLAVATAESVELRRFRHGWLCVIIRYDY